MNVYVYLSNPIIRYTGSTGKYPISQAEDNKCKVSLASMANSITTITWDIAEDPFNTTNVGEEGLDKKWFELAELLGEDRKKDL
jgi:hypothetical protein